VWIRARIHAYPLRAIRPRPPPVRSRAAVGAHQRRHTARQARYLSRGGFNPAKEATPVGASDDIQQDGSRQPGTFQDAREQLLVAIAEAADTATQGGSRRRRQRRGRAAV
jgi:hypothetical protein